ncbi:MAG: SDR family NAD(P)-dependent oxidoreductase [Alphaproteobacteria bacterium]|jgi:NAD(P)-dependent dehydrogenase (short-subunit alcohol dehydrogenase family)|nr:SDR family NAD(P)-dependent oxidoreductase [Alphaproteobacteria bacterium]
MNYNNCNAVITGGASGLGGATADNIIEHGGKVTIIDIQEELGMKKAEKLGSNCQYLNVDITNEDLVSESFKTILKNTGSINLTVNCAGIGSPSKVLNKEGTCPLNLFSKIINVNLIGTFNTLKAAANIMQANNIENNSSRGVIINTASIAAYDGQIGQAAYSASKGGIIGMTLPIARELARQSIRVNTIAPGLFETPLLAGLPEEAKNSLIDSTLHPHRLGHPSEYAALVKHIYENEMLNGETIRLDGSLRMAPR